MAVALWVPCAQVVKKLAKVKGLDVNQSVDDGPTPFIVACYQGCVKVVEFLPWSEVSEWAGAQHELLKATIRVETLVENLL